MTSCPKVLEYSARALQAACDSGYFACSAATGGGCCPNGCTCTSSSCKNCPSTPSYVDSGTFVLIILSLSCFLSTVYFIYRRRQLQMRRVHDDDMMHMNVAAMPVVMAQRFPGAGFGFPVATQVGGSAVAVPRSHPLVPDPACHHCLSFIISAPGPLGVLIDVASVDGATDVGGIITGFVTAGDLQQAGAQVADRLIEIAGQNVLVLPYAAVIDALQRATARPLEIKVLRRNA